jgi:folate-binding protein YgfZ
MEPLPLHSIHEEEGAVYGDLNGREVVARGPGEPTSIEAARTGVVLLDASYREWLRVTGEDRESFLHGMVTNEVTKLPVGTATYAAMLTPKGAMVADVRLLKREGDLLLDVEPGHGVKVREFLEKFLISEDAELHDETATHALLTLGGPRTPELLAKLGLEAPAQHQSRQGTVGGVGVTLLGNDVVLAHGVDVIAPRQGLAAVYPALKDVGEALGLLPLGVEGFEVLRVEAGVPRYGLDMDDKTIPLEANLERAINYKKGCYIGQEVIARGTFRGHMNRKLMGLLLGSQTPAARTELFSGEKKVGWVTSVVRSEKRGQTIALGYVHRDFLTPGTRLLLAGMGEAEVHPLPF